ncbi:MAG: TadE/TadG family type IV pilus assembly protein [Geodermatophilaceae bacterium]
MRGRRRDRGAAVVEFALIVPVLLLLVLGIAEFGHAYQVQTSLSAAAREGVRVMALQNDPAAARDTTRASAPTLNLTNAQISVSPGSCAATSTAPAATATVTVTYQMGFLTGLFGSGITLTGKGSMRCTG